MTRSTVGNGPLCPVDPEHGHTYAWGRRWLCPHSAHGGNGKFFSDEEAHGKYELKEHDLESIYANAVQRIAAGETTIELAVRDIAARTQRTTSSVRESLNLMIEVTTAHKEQREMAKTTAKAKTPKVAPKAAGTRRTLEHVDGSEFARVRDELGLTNKQAAEATGAAGMGKSSTYIYIVTHDGSSAALFAKYEKALKDYAKLNKIKKPKAAAAPAAPAPEGDPEPEAEASEDAADEARV